MKEIVESLRAQNFEGNGFNVQNVSDQHAYLIGIDQLGSIVFLIKPVDEMDSVVANSSRGRHLDILFNTECEVYSKGTSSIGEYTILILKTDNDFFETIFLTVCSDLMDILGVSPDYSEVVRAVEALRELFRKSMNNSSIKELGLWGELLVIELSNNKRLLIDSWHINPKDTFDFNDGKTRLEIKTTMKNERVHVVKLNQVLKARESGSLICSIMTSEIDNGKSIKDLFDSIVKSIDHEYKMKLTDKLMAVAGANIEDFLKKYDYRAADMSKEFYDAKEIPAIDLDLIDTAISDVKYSVSLENVPTYKTEGSDETLLVAVN